MGYGKRGHIESYMKPTPEFDDAASNVTFKIAVNEGPQYRMGTVEFKGFSVADIATLSKKWNLKSGAVYDQSYAAQFLQKNGGEFMSRIAKERLAQGKPVPNLNTSEKPNRQTLTVDLMIELKN